MNNISREINEGDKVKFIVGLGNPSKEYSLTRHNVGFRAVDKYIESKNLGSWKEKMSALYIETIIKDEKVMFLKPQKYMNLSGEPIFEYLKFYKEDASSILIIHDDLDLPCGTIRLRQKGSSGGHNGLKNIELHLKTEEYKRIKIGISNNKEIDTKDFVLGKFSKEEKKEIDKAIDQVCSIIDDYFEIDFEELQNKYN